MDRAKIMQMCEAIKVRLETLREMQETDGLTSEVGIAFQSQCDEVIGSWKDDVAKHCELPDCRHVLSLAQIAYVTGYLEGRSAGMEVGKMNPEIASSTKPNGPKGQ